MAELVPVIEIGGTHVSAAVVETAGWRVEQQRRVDLDAHGDADSVLSAWASAGAGLDAASGVVWGVAMPDPFDYAHGIATFQDVGKYDALFGVDVGAALRERLPQRPSGIVFLNDADAFVLGEWTQGAAAGMRRCVGVTLGTGLGTGWIVDGHVVLDEPGVPHLGRARTLDVDGQGLEEVVSRRGIRRAFAEAGGDPATDVREIAGLARGGDRRAAGVFEAVFDALGRGLGPSLRAFEAEIVVVGGSIAGAWDLIEAPLRLGLDWADAPPIVLAAHPEDAALRGAARAAFDVSPSR